MEALYNYIKDGNSIVDLLGALIILAFIALSLEKIFFWIKKYLDLYTQRKIAHTKLLNKLYENEHKINNAIEKDDKQDEQIEKIFDMMNDFIAKNDIDMQVIHRKEIKHYYELAISQGGKLSDKDIRDFRSSLECYQAHHGNGWVHSDIMPYMEQVQPIISDSPTQIIN